MSARDFSKYYAALDADSAFVKELRRVYGKDACNARYKREHADAGVIRAAAEFKRATAAWLDEARADIGQAAP